MLMGDSSELARYLCFGKCFLDKRWPVSIENFRSVKIRISAASFLMGLKCKMGESFENIFKERQIVFLWRHSAINYINDGKSLYEAVEIANKKYSVNFDESLLFV